MGIYINGNANPQIHDNDIRGNATYGVQNENSSTEVIAEENYWGAANGPSGAGTGSGDAVSTNVDYDPFLTASAPCTVPLNASFAAEPTGGCQDLTVSFTDGSTGAITAWEWDLSGDGAIDTTEQNPVCTYTNPDTYTVTLTVYEGTESDTASQDINVTESLPTTGFEGGPLLSGTPPLTVNFTDLSASCGTDSITNWEWDFDNDGTIDSYDQNPSRIFYNAGNYTVKLTVTDEDSDQDTETKENYIYVSDEAPVADPGGPYTGTEGTSIHFDGSDSYDPNGGELTFDWDFGDGSAHSSAENPWHTYSQDSEEQTGSTYTVTLTVYDEAGLLGTNTTTSEVADIDPAADFTADPTDGTVPLTVQFTDITYSYDGIVSREWNFGDGSELGTAQNPEHIYADAGTYTVTLTVTEDDGDNSTKEKVEYITVSECTVYYYDGDQDGFGTDDSECLAAPTGFYTALVSGDCDDTRDDVNPGAAEVCDGVDNDCDGEVDEGVTTTFYQDSDSDGFGNPAVTVEACSAPEGYVADNTDCDDTRGDVYPGAEELCDGVDNDCDGEIDEGVTTTFYQDSDSDGFGNPAVTVEACSAPEGYVADNTDCDDTRNDVNPGAAEVCDGVDNDCDGEIDEGVTTTFYQDSDSDGFGNPAVTVEACSAPEGYVADNTDCDDTRNDVNPGAEEVCGDGIDNNCNGEIDEGCGCEINEIPGDLDGDCDVDGDDRNILRASLRKCEGASGYNADADYDGDGCITFGDYRIWYGHYKAFLQ